MPALETMGSVPGAVAIVLLLLTAAYGLGGALVPAKRRHFHSSSAGDACLLRLMVGLNLLATLGVVLGQAGVLPGSWPVVLLAAASLFAVPAAKRRMANWGFSSLNASILTRPSLSRRGLDWVVLAAGLVTLGPALCYPTGWDELVYHLVLPQRWLRDGWPAVYFDLPYAAFPSAGEVLFWLMAPVDGVIAPRLLAWGCWILGLLGLYRTLRGGLTHAVSLVLAFVFACSDTLLLISANCYVETILMMNVAGLLLAAQRRFRRGFDGARWELAAVLGVLAGGAASVKLTGAAAIVAMCLCFLFGRTSWRSAARSLGVAMAVALLVCLPFYLRAWLAAGNPFYPYFCEWFTTDATRLDVSRFHHAIGGLEFGVRSIAAFVVAPLLLAFRSRNFDGEFGWQLLGFVTLGVLALATIRRPRTGRRALWPGVAATWLYVFWFATAQQARFAVPAVLALVVFAGSGLRALRGQWRRIALVFLLIAAVCSAPWRRSDYYAASWLTVLHRMRRADYVHNVTDCEYLPMIQAALALTPRDAKFMLLFEHRGFYLPRPQVIGTPLFQEGPFTPPERYATAAEVMKVLVANRVTHLVLTKSPIGPDQAAGAFERQKLLVAAINQCVQQGQLRPLWHSDTHALLEVADERGDPRRTGNAARGASGLRSQLRP